VPEDDKRIRTETVRVPSPAGTGHIDCYLVRPANAKGKLPAIIVIHENRGLNPYVKDVARASPPPVTWRWHPMD
jgi:carboxymethylenebutenolidase